MTTSTPSLLSRKYRCAFSLAFIHFFFTFALALSTPLPALGQKTAAGPQVEIIEPTKAVGSAQDAIKIAFKIKNASQQRIRVRLEGDLDNVVSNEIRLTTKGEHSIRVNLFEGQNRISFIVFEDDEPRSLRSSAVEVVCSGRWCKKPYSLKPGSVAAEVSADDGENSEDVATIDEPKEEKPKTETTAKDEKPKPGKQGAVTEEKPAKKQMGAIHINSPKEDRIYADRKTVPLKVTVDRKSKTDATKNLKTVFITVLNETKPSTKAKDIDYSDGVEKPGKVELDVDIGQGSNEIIVFDEEKKDSERDSVKIVCEEKCGGATETAKKSPINIEQPKNPVNTPSIPATVTVDKGSNIAKIKYYVRNGENLIASNDIPVLAAQPDGKPTDIPVNIRIARGINTVTFVDAEKEDDITRQASTTVICSGDNCAEDFLIAKFSGSQNSRAIVGFEQAGSSSAGSETKPVLDFFFLTPFLFDPRKPCTVPDSFDECKDENDRRRLLPRFGFWGDVRVASTPEQVGAAQVFPTRLVNQVTTSGRSVDLIQSFDFLAGLEGRIKNANSGFLSLIPGFRQKSSLYWTVGGGAISPLSVRRESVQIFNIPGANDPRREEFINRFGLNGTIPLQPGVNPAKEKEYVAIAPVERDRFFHQWYAGLRLKTFYCENPSCTRFRNSFPAIVDLAIGQNEAVTGGSRKRGGTPDPNNPDKLIGRRNSYVLRVDGFYPFPLKEASFLYFYGTALMKIGGGGVKITTPLFLDNPGTTVELSDPRVYIPPTNILKLQQPDRDYYKIGVGVNLTDLFNRNKQPE